MATPAFEEIAETFDFLDDWEDRYRHVIELGKAMPAMDPVLQVPDARRFITVDGDLRVGDAMFGDHVLRHRGSHVLDQ